MVEPGFDVAPILAEINVLYANSGWELVHAPTGWNFSTHPAFGPAVQVGLRLEIEEMPLSQAELEVLMTIAYFQPVTRGEIATIRGRKEVRTEWLKRFLGVGWIDLGPRRVTAARRRPTSRPRPSSIISGRSYGVICWYGPKPIAPRIQSSGLAFGPSASRTLRQPK